MRSWYSLGRMSCSPSRNGSSLGRLTSTSPLLVWSMAHPIPPCSPRVRSEISSKASRSCPRLTDRTFVDASSHAALPHTWGASVSMCAPLPLPSERPSRMFEHSQQCSSLAASLSSSLRSKSETLTCCSRKTAPVRRGLTATKISPVL